MDDGGIKTIAPLTNFSKAIAEVYTPVMQSMGEAIMKLGSEAMRATRGMIQYNNHWYEPSDGSYPPDMDME